MSAVTRRRRALPALLAVAALVIAAALTGSAEASPPRRPAPVLTWVGVLSAHECGGVLTVRYGLERPAAGGAWTPVPDSWGTDVQLRYVGNGSPEGGRWVDAPEPTQRVQGLVSVPVTGLPTWDLVRVVMVVDGVRLVSSGRDVLACDAPAEVTA